MTKGSGSQRENDKGVSWMIRWTQLLQSLVADTKLGPQLQLWRSDPHSTPLALFRGSKIFAANQAALDYFACVHQEILDATLYDFAPRLQLGGQSSIELAKKLLQAATAKSQVQEWLHLNRHGKELPTRLYLEPVRIDSNRMILVRFEALDRRLGPRGEAQDVFGLLPRSVLAGILEESAEAVVISDTSGKILAVNRALCRLCGFSQAQLIGQQLQILETANDPNRENAAPPWRSGTSGRARSAIPESMAVTFPPGRAVAGCRPNPVVIWSPSSAISASASNWSLA